MIIMQFKINEKIKELYGSKASFCAENGHKYKDFASKLRTLQNRIDWLNNFLKPLNLEIQIADRQKGRKKKNKYGQKATSLQLRTTPL